MAKQVGVREIARLAKVSTGTVDRALNGRKEVSEKTRDKVLKIAQAYGYKPNLAARTLSVGRRSLRVGVCIPRELHYYYDQLRQGIASEAERQGHMGIELLYRPVENLGESENEVIRELLDCGIKALILTPGDSAGVAPSIDEAEKNCNVRVVCVTNDSAQSARSATVSSDPELTGTIAGELMAKFVPPGSRVAIITGMLQVDDHRLRVEGFQNTFAVECSGGVVAQVIEGHENETETLRRSEQLLRDDPHLAGIYVSTVNCLPVCRALCVAGKAGVVRLITTDLFSEAAPYLIDRTITASIYQRPFRQGQMALRLIADHFASGEGFPSVENVNPVVVLRSNLRMFRGLFE